MVSYIVSPAVRGQKRHGFFPHAASGDCSRTLLSGLGSPRRQFPGRAHHPDSPLLDRVLRRRGRRHTAAGAISEICRAGGEAGGEFLFPLFLSPRHQLPSGGYCDHVSGRVPHAFLEKCCGGHAGGCSRHGAGYPDGQQHPKSTVPDVLAVRSADGCPFRRVRTAVFLYRRRLGKRNLPEDREGRQAP